VNRPVVAGILLAWLLLPACGEDGGPEAGRQSPRAEAAPLDDGVRLNQLQAVGTHNSFHVELEPPEMAILERLNPTEAAERAYTHAPIDEQLDAQRVRQLELDIYLDAEGGRFADPWIRREAGLGPYDEPAMAEPGIKVFHEQDVDYRTVCATFVSCLQALEDWSDANRDHAPVAVNVQLRDGPLIFAVPEQVRPESFLDEAAMDAIDEEILSVFDRDRIIAPDDVRGDRATLNEAVLARGWPTLGASRGKVLFTMVNADPYRIAYRNGHQNLEGRLLFTNAPAGEPDAAFVNLDDPLELGPRIADLVGEGYLVRTRADDADRLDAALRSGAHWISTDHPDRVRLPEGGAVRCNPVAAADDCDDARLERLG
jgi:hypothetical protein